MDKRARSLLAVQVAPVLILARFALLGLYDLWAGTDFQMLKLYALVSGLVTPFLAAASLRARVVLLSRDSVPEHFGPMQRLLLAASGVGIAGALVVLQGTEYVVIGLLVALAKVTENLLDAHLAYLQRVKRRDAAIHLQLWRNAGALAPYGIVFLIESLEAVVLMEALVGLVALRGFFLMLPVSRQPKPAYGVVLRSSALVSVAAFFNGFMITLMLRSLLGAGFVASAEALGLIAGLFAVTGRILNNTNLFYKRRIDDLITGVVSSAWTFGGIVAVVAGVLVLNVHGDRGPIVTGSLLAILVLLNAFALSARTSLLVRGDVLVIVGLHVLECLAVVLWFPATESLILILNVLILSRLVRTVLFSRRHTARPIEMTPCAR